MIRMDFLGAFALICLWAGAALAQPVPAYVVFFPEWSAALDDAAHAVLAQAAGAARGSDARLVITGYADHKGSKQADLDLSQLRAQVVQDALLADGIPAARTRLVAAGAQSGTGVADRRVEIVIGAAP
jgi:peptidoglycan-associated lipoprotein